MTLAGDRNTHDLERKEPAVPSAIIDTGDPRAVSAITAIHQGEHTSLRRLLLEHPELATAALATAGKTRSLLHVATDWPGHYPQVAASIAILVAAGADVDARFIGPHNETPLHWAASSDDVDALDALLDAGADIEAPALSSPEAHRSTTPSPSPNGRQHGASSSAARTPTCSTRPVWA